MKRKEKETAKANTNPKAATKKGAQNASQPDEKNKKPISDYVVKPKKALSTWLIFNTETVAKLREKGLEHKDAFQKSAEIWKKLSDKQKEPYNQKQALDQKRYENQCKELEDKGYFMNTDGIKSTDMDIDPRKKYGKNCLLPKRPLSAYLFYTGENVNKVKEKEKCTHIDAMKKCADLWNKMNDKQKKKYTDQHDKDVKRNEKQLSELNKKGFFIMDDGSKSSDHQAKEKKKKKSKDEDTNQESQNDKKPTKKQKK